MALILSSSDPSTILASPRAKLIPLLSAALLTMGMTLSPASASAQTVDRRNAVSFSATATEEVTQNLLTVVLQAHKDGSQASEVQSALKQLLDTALAEARKAAQPGTLEVRTGGFSIHPRYSSQGKINGWQGQAQLVLEGTDMVRIAQTAGRLNQLNVVQVSYGLSRELREKHEAALTARAIASYRSKAQDLARSFGFAGYTLGEVSVQSGEPGFENRQAPMMVKMASAADAAETPLPVEPGKGVITTTVSGHVILTP